MLRGTLLGTLVLVAATGCTGTGPAAPPGPSAAQIALVGRLCVAGTTYRQILHDFHTLPDNTLDPAAEANAFLTAETRLTGLRTQLQGLGTAPLPHGGDVVAGYLASVNRAESQVAQFHDLASAFLRGPTEAQAGTLDSSFVIEDVQLARTTLGGPDLRTDPDFAAEYRLARDCR